MPEESRYQLDIPKGNILSWLFPEGQSVPDKTIWLDAERPNEISLSSRQALVWVRRLGLCFDRLGVQQNEVVLVYSPNHVFMPIPYLAAVGYGRIFSAVNPAYNATEVKFQIENTGAKVMFVEPSLIEIALEAAGKANLPNDRIFLFSDEQCQSKDGIQDWRSILPSEQESANHPWRHLSEKEARETVAVLNFSSGTTGLPKGVMVSHQNVIANAEQNVAMRSINDETFQIQPPLAAPDERWLGFLPMYHAYGQLWYVCIACRLQIPTYFMRAFEYLAWLRHIQTHRITHIQAAPPVLVMLAKRPETKDFDLSSLRDIICGAAPLSRELQNQVMETLGNNLRVVQGWGATEATCGQTMMPGLMRDFTGCIGRIFPECEVMVVNDEGQELRDNERGELWIRGPNITLGYWKNEKATKESYTEEGYWKTGDIGIKDKGWFWIVDRKKELIKVRGFQVAPAELEAALLENDDVADAAVVALKIEHEERPRAYVTMKDHAQGKYKEQDIINWLNPRVSRYKQLTGGCKFVDAVPKSPSGKIQRVIMREWAARDAKEIEDGGIKAKL